MPKLRAPRPRRPGRPSRRATPGPARIVVLGDLVLDVVVAPARALERATDVPGRVSLVQGGSAANAARWLARLGARTTLVAAVGRDAVGRSLVDAIRGDGVQVRVVRVAGARTGRIGVIVSPDGERSFVADRGAAASAATGGCATRMVHPGRRAAPADVLVPGRTAGRGRPTGRIAGPRRGRVREHRPGIDRAAAGTWTSRGGGPHQGGRPGPDLRDRGGGAGPPGRRAWATACSTTRQSSS